MKDEDETKEQLINELMEMHREIAELKASEAERKLKKFSIDDEAFPKRTFWESNVGYF